MEKKNLRNKEEEDVCHGVLLKNTGIYLLTGGKPYLVALARPHLDQN